MAERGGRKVVVAALLALVLIAGATRARAEEDEHRYASDFGVGVGAVFTNLLYMPAKFVYATVGGVTGSLAYVLTGFNMGIAKSIWVPSLGGTYVVTPSMLKGEDRIYFSGTTEPTHHGSREEDLGSSHKRDDDGY
jgi:hypothetical protein